MSSTEKGALPMGGIFAAVPIEIAERFAKGGRIELGCEVRRIGEGQWLSAYGKVSVDGVEYGVGEVWRATAGGRREPGEKRVFTFGTADGIFRLVDGPGVKDKIIDAFVERGEPLAESRLVKLVRDGRPVLGFRAATCLVGDEPILDIVAIIQHGPAEDFWNDVVMVVRTDGSDQVIEIAPALSAGLSAVIRDVLEIHHFHWIQDRR
jgi:hypothetical protein